MLGQLCKGSAAVLLITMLTSCTSRSTSNRNNATVRAGNVLTIKGRIDDVLIGIVEGQLNGLNTIIITSQGGDNYAAIALAKIIYNHHIKVVAREECLSACSSFILVASPVVVIEPRTVIGFHQTSTAMDNVLQNSVEPSHANYYHATSLQERGLYRYIKASDSLLLRPFLSIIPLCFRMTKIGDEDVAGVSTRFAYSIPSLEQFRQWSHHETIIGWPNNPSQWSSTLREMTPSIPSNAFVFQRSEDRDGRDTIHNRTLQACGDAPAARLSIASPTQ